MLLALAFVPVRNVPESFEELADSSPACLGSVIDYWEDIYIGRQRRNRRGNLHFPSNCGACTIDYLTDYLEPITRSKGGIMHFRTPSIAIILRSINSLKTSRKSRTTSKFSSNGMTKAIEMLHPRNRHMRKLHDVC